MTTRNNKPFDNCYWVEPGRLLAGEYPLTANVQESAVRVQNLLLAGVTRFINLTAAAELSDYVGYLPARFAGKPVSMERLSIKDHGVPEQAEAMTRILERIDAALKADEMVYVHCRAGIGRTGTVVGCYLARHGLNGEQAIDKLNELWLDCARAYTWPVVPETEAQEQFIRDYSVTLRKSKVVAGKPAVPVTIKLAGGPHSRHDRYQGALLGMAIAETLARQGQPAESDLAHIGRLDQAGWSSDTAMTWALADSLLQCRGMQPQDQMQRYLNFIKHKEYLNHAHEVEVSALVRKAIAHWQWKQTPLAGSHDPALIEAHPLARTTAVVLYFARQPSCLLESGNAARTTLQSPIVLDACRVFAAVLLTVLEGQPVANLVSLRDSASCIELRKLTLKPEVQTLIDGGWRHALHEPAGEDVVSVLASALHALFTTHNFAAAIQRCTQRARQPSAVAAVCGALAGALYGVQGLPIIWRETLVRGDELRKVADRLLIEAPDP